MARGFEYIDLPDAELYFFKQAFNKLESKSYFNELIENIPWRQERIKMFGKGVLIPRLQSWFGDSHSNYSYSGLAMQPIPWNDSLTSIKQIVENLSAQTFNSALLNLYRDGSDSMGFHSDDEKELGINPVIASVSFGANRSFIFKHRQLNLTHKIDLHDGSLLLMAGKTQHHWRHGINKSKRITSARINITFRQIINAGC